MSYDTRTLYVALAGLHEIQSTETNEKRVTSPTSCNCAGQWTRPGADMLGQIIQCIAHVVYCSSPNDRARRRHIAHVTSALALGHVRSAGRGTCTHAAKKKQKKKLVTKGSVMSVTV